MRVGTGWVKCVQKYTEDDKKLCECVECSRADTHTPNKVWGKVTIGTACHVVSDCDEARCTTCYFFYDRSTSYVSDFPTLTGLRVKYSDIRGDMCLMTCVTHDMDLVDKLVKMCDCRLQLFEKVRSKYWLDQRKGLSDPGMSYVTDPIPGHVVIISHPHGCSKQISIGKWTHRETQGETQKYKENTGLKADFVSSSYRYNAATCPGSSGAPVIRLLEKGRVGWWWLLYSHPHSGGDAGNNNYSGRMEEFVAFPPTSSDRIPKSEFAKFLLGIVLGFIVGRTVVLADMGNWGLYDLTIIFCQVMIPVLCYRFIPSYRIHRGLIWSFVIVMVFGSLCYTMLVVVALTENDHISLQAIFYGVFCMIGIVGSVFYFRQVRADALTSYKIQRRLRS